jgi:hypothetical protein
MKRKCIFAAVLLISAVSTGSAQTYWSYGAYGPWRYRAYDLWRYREYGLKARAAAGTSTAMDLLIATPLRRPAATPGAETLSSKCRRRSAAAPAV